MNNETKNNISEEEKTKKTDEFKEEEDNGIIIRLFRNKITRRILIFLITFFCIFAFTKMENDKQFKKMEDRIAYESQINSRYPDKDKLSNDDIVLRYYAKEKAKKLMDAKGFKPSSKGSLGKYHYEYKSEKFKQLGKLNDIWVYSMSEYVDKETLNKIMVANGYISFEDYLMNKGFVHDNGEANEDAFTNYCWTVLDKEYTENVINNNETKNATHQTKQ